MIARRPNDRASAYSAVLIALVLVSCGRTGIFPYPAQEPDAPADVTDVGFDPILDVPPDEPLPTCGDGELDEGEECDDGNAIDDDACSNACRLVPDDPCSPCVVDNDCARPQDLCVELLDGSFCGLDCLNDADCPDGYVCDEAATTAGQLADQCVPELDVCAGCLDNDEDGFGVGAECLGPDCNDEDPTIHPFADEFCDGVDTDCDGVLDEADALDAPVWFRDADDDGFGNPALTRFACTQPNGWVDNPDDCDDTDPNINPAALEICDDRDNNCNLLNDEGCPPDLIVDDEVVELAGEHLFDRVEILNGGIVEVTPFDGQPGRPETGTPGTGCLEIEARIVVIRANSGIEASGVGGAGIGLGREAGFGPGLQNTGPSGGGYGGRGGNSDGLTGGVAFGTPSGEDYSMGSNGGSFSVLGSVAPACDPIMGLVSEGGVGGGCVWLSAATAIRIDGFIRARGGNGDSARDSNTPAIVDGGAGGSGGGIVLRANRVTTSEPSVLDVRGGAGGNGATFTGSPDPGESCIGNGAGGGGGGRVKVFANSTSLDGRVIRGGGRAGQGPQSDAFAGAAGTLFAE